MISKFCSEYQITYGTQLLIFEVLFKNHFY